MIHQNLIVLLRKFQQREDGAVAIIFALLILFVFVPILAVSTELGLRTMEQRKLQHQADMAAYSAVVALTARFPDEDRVGGTCPPQLGVDAANFAASGSEYSGPALECAGPDKNGVVHFKNILLVDEKTLGLCGIPDNLDSFDGLCVRLTLDQDRLFSRVFSLFTNQDADQAVRLSALAVAQFEGVGGRGGPTCIRAGDTINSNSNSTLIAPDCMIAAKKAITGFGGDSEIGNCLGNPEPTSISCLDQGTISPSDKIFDIPPGLEWVTDPNGWDNIPDYCETEMTRHQGQVEPLIDGQIYCTNEKQPFGLPSGNVGFLTGSGHKGNLLIVGPDADLSFTGNAGFNFNALAWENLPAELRERDESPNNMAAGILIYAPASEVGFGGNQNSLAEGEGCRGIIANTVRFFGGGELRITCDPNNLGDSPGNPPAPISLAF